MVEVRTTIHFPDGYDMDAVDEIVDKFDEAWHDYQSQTVYFNGSSERSNELVRAIDTAGKHDAVRTTRFVR